MADLKEISELAWRQLFPNPGDESAITREEFIATAKSEYAFQTLLNYWNTKNLEGEYSVPSHLLEEKELEVVNDEIDISKLNVFKSLPFDVWLQNIGGINCSDCKYVKSTVNHSQLLCDDDGLGDSDKTYYVLREKIKFPKGTHKSKLPVIYANMGENVNEEIVVDDAIGGIVRSKLIEIYGGKTGKEDKTNNSASE